MSDNELEKHLAEISKAPRVSFDNIKANIESEYFFTGKQALQGAYEGVDPDLFHESVSLLTFCILVLKNGFTVIGKSACASPENYKKDVGEEIAKNDAINQIWPLMGYELRTKLMNEPKTYMERMEIEFNELTERFNKLDTFIKRGEEVGEARGGNMGLLSAEGWADLRKQRTIMADYMEILERRMISA